jgi:hypothetical protein
MFATQPPAQAKTNTEDTRRDHHALIAVYERAKTVHALNHAATVIGVIGYKRSKCSLGPI